ncbi:hypothetical protein [Microcoleus sp. B13-B6]|uniref:hypothetical protein n=1 Tax=Microcoleus sp. B13-B6 TaxID=2818652 RepID=UPI002FD1533E
MVTGSDGEKSIGRIVGWKCDRIPKDIDIAYGSPPPSKPIKSPLSHWSSNPDIRFNTDPPNLPNVKIP